MARNCNRRPRSILIILAVLLTLPLLANTARPATIYRWVDENGVVNFSDQPPPLHYQGTSRRYQVRTGDSPGQEESPGISPSTQEQGGEPGESGTGVGEGGDAPADSAPGFEAFFQETKKLVEDAERLFNTVYGLWRSAEATPDRSLFFEKRASYRPAVDDAFAAAEALNHEAPTPQEVASAPAEARPELELRMRLLQSTGPILLSLKQALAIGNQQGVAPLMDTMVEHRGEMLDLQAQAENLSP